MIIYIDILIITNIIINYFLLLLTVNYCSYKTDRKRILISSIIGGFYSLVSLLPNLKFLSILILKLLCCFLMVLILFGRHNWLKYYYTFIVINFIFSGLMLALWFFIAPPGMNVNNGVLYFNISTKTLVISIIASYVVIHIFSIISKKVPITVANYLATIYIGQKQLTLKGFVDTGNFLQDIFSATPVVICRFKAIESILPDDIKSVVINKKIPKNSNLSKFHIRFIPYQTIDNEHFIVAFKPNKFILTSSSTRFEISDVYIGLALDQNLFNNEFDIILNPKLLK